MKLRGALKHPIPDKDKDNATRQRMQDMAHAIDERLPQGWGYFVLAFPFEGHEGRANYCSNAQRKDVLNLMKEFLIRAGAAEDWMKHID